MLAKHHSAVGAGLQQKSHVASGRVCTPPTSRSNRLAPLQAVVAPARDQSDDAFADLVKLSRTEDESFQKKNRPQKAADVLFRQPALMADCFPASEKQYKEVHHPNAVLQVGSPSWRG